jgi:hypothetical protein
MCVDVDKAGSDKAASGIDLLAAFSGDFPDRGDAAANDGNISLDRPTAFTIGDGAALYDQIVGGIHGIVSSNSCRQNGLASKGACQGKSAPAAAGNDVA